MGPSGSGKSTLMHLLAGLDKPTLRLRRRRRPGARPPRRQGPHAAAPRPARLRLPGLQPRPGPHRRGEHRRCRSRSPAASPTRSGYDTLIATVGLGDRLTHRPSELSGGQQQRVAVARALIHRPAVVFADEPTGNLDSKSSDEVLGLLRHAVDDFGQTVVMVTHDAHAASVADRIVVLSDGRDRARRRRRDHGGRPRPDEGGGVVAQGRAEGPRGPQAAHGTDRLRRRHRRRLRGGHVRLHGHDRRLVQGPVRAHARRAPTSRSQARLAVEEDFAAAADDAERHARDACSRCRASRRRSARSPTT